MGFRTGASPDQRAMETQIDDEMLALITQLTNEINWHMRERGLTRADLAARMGVSPGRVSQILGGGENLTLRTLAALSTALEARFDVELSALKDGDLHQPRRGCGRSRSGREPPRPFPGQASRDPAQALSGMSPQLGPLWPLRRPPYRVRAVRERIDDLALSIDQPWCFLGNEGPDGQRRDADPGRVLRPDSGRNPRRG